QRPSALVLEREHLLLDDVGGLPHPAGEEIGVLEDGCVDPAVSGRPEPLGRDLDDARANRLRLGQHVERAPRGLAPLAHSPSLVCGPVIWRARPGTGCWRARRPAW